MAMADPKALQEAISELSKYISSVSNATAEMSSAAKDCISNMNGDPKAGAANEKVQASVGRINEALEHAKKELQAMQEELEEWNEAASIEL